MATWNGEDYATILTDGKLEDNISQLRLQDDKIQSDVKFMNYLKEENDKMREETICQVCLDNKRNHLFLPCGHMVACGKCTSQIIKCPVCRHVITAYAKVHTVSSEMPEYIYRAILKETREKCFQ